GGAYLSDLAAASNAHCETLPVCGGEIIGRRSQSRGGAPDTCARLKGRKFSTPCARLKGRSRYTCAKTEGEEPDTCARLKGRSRVHLCKTEGEEPVHLLQD
ncbi:unnamed protein product, partial [Staurois parvus]